MRRRVAVVVNRASGSLIGSNLADQIAGYMEAAGLDATVVEEPQSLSERIDAAFALRPDAIVVAGGDGTVACAAQRLVDTDIALGIVPLGTMNLLAKDLNIPLDTEAACKALAEGAIRQIDVGDVNGNLFLCNSVLGLPARLAQHRERHRGEMNFRRYVHMAMAGARALVRYPPLRVAVDIGAGPRRVRAWAIAVVSNDYEEGVGRMFRRGSLDQGEFAMYVTGKLGVWPVVRLGVGMAVGSWRNAPGLQRSATTELTIHSHRRSLRVMNDGEVQLLKPPLHYRIRPLALNVIVPPEGEQVEAEPVSAATEDASSGQ